MWIWGAHPSASNSKSLARQWCRDRFTADRWLDENEREWCAQLECQTAVDMPLISIRYALDRLCRSRPWATNRTKAQKIISKQSKLRSAVESFGGFVIVSGVSFACHLFFDLNHPACPARHFLILFVIKLHISSMKFDQCHLGTVVLWLFHLQWLFSGEASHRMMQIEGEWVGGLRPKSRQRWSRIFNA